VPEISTSPVAGTVTSACLRAPLTKTSTTSSAAITLGITSGLQSANVASNKRGLPKSAGLPTLTKSRAA
jgi:hypothetical protein